MLSRNSLFKRGSQAVLLCLGLFVFLGAGDESARFNELGHRLMCVCGCKQILLECNHVGCQYSDRMRGELMTALDHGDSDDLALQALVQKYGTAVMAAPTTTGFNRIAWIMPFVALMGGLAAVVILVRAWKMRPAALPAGGVRTVSWAQLEHFRKQAQKETEI